jgi:nicotinamidase-related amidase
MAEIAMTVSAAQCHLLSFRPAELAIDDLIRFEEVARKLDLPTIVCADIFVDTTILRALAEKLGAPKSIHPREIILVCGAYLEEQISLAVQYLLAVGYPVFLLRDLIVAKNAQHSYVHDWRLSVTGAVATTSQQLMYEWAASEADPIRKVNLSNLLVLGTPR